MVKYFMNSIKFKGKKNQIDILRIVEHVLIVNYFLIGKSSAYPLRNAQRNLNKFLLGTDNECESQQSNGLADTRTSPKSMFELDSLINNVLNGNNSYSNEPTSTQATTSAKETNNSALRSMSLNSSSNQKGASALKNDVKLIEYSSFESCFTMQQHQSHSTGASDLNSVQATQSISRNHSATEQMYVKIQREKRNI